MKGSARLFSQALPGDLLQLAIGQRYQPVQSLVVAVVPIVQQLGDMMRGVQSIQTSTK